MRNLHLGLYTPNQGVPKHSGSLFHSTRAATEKKKILEEEFGVAMNEELEREVLVMCNLSQGVKAEGISIKGGKISAQLLKAALTKLLSEIEKKKQQSKKMGGQNRCKRGKQSIKSLQQSGAQLTNIVVTDNNIKSFDRVARKYGIDYSLKKAEKEGKTEYLVFFKAKDVDVMTAAFKEYTGVSLKKEQRQSIRKKLEQAKERVAKHREITKEKMKDRGQVR